MTNEFIADQQWFRSANGLSLLAGSPLTSFTVSEAGARVLDAIENGAPLPDNHVSLTSRLLATGAIHPLPNQSVSPSDISVVIPALVHNENERERLQSLVNQLSNMTVIVVDDASPQPISLNGATVIRRDSNGGPGAARNSGVREVSTPYVAFVDADIVVASESLRMLASVLLTDNVVLVAPRVATENDKTFLGEYESLRSPLDLGTSPAVVRPLSRVSYVPAAVLVGRTQQLIDAFDESMRLGEDVDMVWRIAESGGVVRYVPSVECHHEPRATWRALLKQRFGYGSSAATLDKRHPFAASPFRSHGVLVLPALALLSGYIYFALLLAIPTYVYFAITLRSTKLSVRMRARITWIGFTATVRLLAAAIRRVWWPVIAIAMALFQPALFLMLFSVLAAPAYGIVRAKPKYPGEYFLMRILDDCAYGLGVWAGAIRTRNFRCLLPVITFRRTSRAK